MLICLFLLQFPHIINLNVGGFIFTTRLATIRKYPDNMLGAMFSGRYPIQKDKDGNYFIDRDGTYFRHLLNFLRDERCLPPTDVAPEVMKEAMFFGIGQLEKRMKLYKCLFADFVIWESVRRNIEDYYKIKEHMIAIACQVHLEKGKIPPGLVLMEIVIEEDVTFQDYERQYKRTEQRNQLIHKHFVTVRAKTYEHALNVRSCFHHDLSKDGYKFVITSLHPSYLDPDTEQYTHRPLMIFNVMNLLFKFEW
ncbi:Hypothetical predicted protein [Mytilus galloprovincialis]|uniref:BTB domain-containing protein n=1 Tax=Mytilus galloprovincialis TaxID=29158 RepID=A0A8B6GN76_MYTGA|nr:Hypothetical predicted protein [Mytilus galloprovincialis]